MTETERNLRIELAACYRIFAYLGWDELIYNHITVKIPDTPNHFLINPYGLHYSEITASSLLKVDITGNKIDDSDYDANPAGMVIHSAVHAARPDLHCITHLHTNEGLAVACSKNGLRYDNFYSVMLYNRVAYHDFEGLTVNEGEKERLVASLGNHSQLILRNHGLLSAGGTIEEAFIATWTLQRACEIQVACDATGQEVIPISAEIGEKTEQLLETQIVSAGLGRREYAAMRRLVAQHNPGFDDL